MAVSRLSQSTLQNAFSKYNSIWDGKSAVGSMEAISAITLSASQATVEFNNIPQTYSHLQIRFIARSDFNNATYGCVDSYIEDTTPGSTITNYYSHTLYGNGTSASTLNAAGGFSTAQLTENAIPSSICASYIFGSGIIDILDYTNTNKNITVKTVAGVDLNGATPSATWNSHLGFTSTSWARTVSTSALRLSVDGNWVANSSFTLYGIK